MIVDAFIMTNSVFNGRSKVVRYSHYSRHEKDPIASAPSFFFFHSFGREIDTLNFFFLGASFYRKIPK